MDELSIRKAGRDDVARVEHLWLSLFAHQTAFGPHEPLSAGESWSRRRTEYLAWLAEPDAFIALAEHGKETIGYVLVHFMGPDDTWRTGDRIAEIESLSVAPDWRGRGVGTALLDFVDDQLLHLGVEDARLSVVIGNSDAIRFYKRRGFLPRVISMSRFGITPGA